MLKFSQSQSSIHGVNSARLHSRPSTDIKTNVVTSRPVDRQPVIQEAVAPPPPLTRTPGIQDLSFAGITEGSQSATAHPESLRPSRGEVKIEVIHVNTSQSQQQQQQQQPQVSLSTKPQEVRETHRVSPKERRIPVTVQPPTLDLPPPPSVPPPQDPPNSESYEGELPLPPTPPSGEFPEDPRKQLTYDEERNDAPPGSPSRR